MKRTISLAKIESALMRLLVGVIAICALSLVGSAFDRREFDLSRYAPTADYTVQEGGWLLSYDGRTRCARWALEKIDRNTKATERASFHEALNVPEEFRPKLSAYSDSGFDVGHVAAAANHGNTEDEERSTFTPANACPEFPKMNRGLMRTAEMHVRTLAQQLGVKHVLVVTAPVWLPGPHKMFRFEAIGEARIWVPTHVDKCVAVFYSDGKIELKAWRIPNIADLDMTLEDVAISTDEAESDIGANLWSGVPAENDLESAK